MQEGMETKRSGLLQSQAKRVKMKVSVMASPNRKHSQNSQFQPSDVFRLNHCYI